MAVYARGVRAPEDPETEPQAYLLARKSAAAPPESAAVSAGNTSWGSAYRNNRAVTAAQSKLRLPGYGNARRRVSTGRVWHALSQVSACPVAAAGGGTHGWDGRVDELRCPAGRARRSS